MIKINLYGGPGSGKSTLSTLLYSELKYRGMKVELVREFAKELVYQGEDMANLKEEQRIHILAEQMRRESIHYGKVDYLITDSPILIAAYYYKNAHAIALSKGLLSEKEFHFLIKRDDLLPFEKYGRAHDEEQAKKIDDEMRDFLSNEQVPFVEIGGAPDERLKSIIQALGQDTSKMRLSIKMNG